MRKLIVTLMITSLLGTGVIWASILINIDTGVFDPAKKPYQVVFINEIMSSNGEVISDRDGDYEDYIELYNPNNEIVDLTGYYLSDNQKKTLKWQFPENTRIMANGFLLVWASGKDKTGKGREIHTNFSISRSGEPIILTAPDGKTVIDTVPPISIKQNTSYGRYPDGSDDWFIFSTDYTTPGGPNLAGEHFISPLLLPDFSRAGGFYTNDFYLKLNQPNSDVTIYYTLDGSEPTKNSILYNEPIHIKGEFIPATREEILIQRINPPTTKVPHPVLPLSMIRTGSRRWVSPLDDIFKATVVRARTYDKEGRASNVITHTYFIDNNMAERYGFPILSITTDMEYLFGYHEGIHVPGVNYDPSIPEEGNDNRTGNYFQRGSEWERPVHLEFYESDGTLAFSQHAGVRIHGGLSRKYPVKSLRFYARNIYDEKNDFNYQFFDDKDIDEFKRIVFRGGGQTFRYTLMGEAVAQSLLKPLQLDIQYSAPSIIFINGEYFGIRNIRDVLNTWHLQTHYGVERDKVTILTGDGVVNDGTFKGINHYIDMRNFIYNRDMSVGGNYNYIQTQMDIDNFIDYYASQIYFANIDWPQNNIRYWRLNTRDYEPGAPYGHDGRWRWMVFDVDAGFGASWGGNSPDYNSFERLTDEGFRTGALWVRLLDNEEFKNQFINRFADLLNTIFVEERAVKAVDEAEVLYEPEMAEHISRWGFPSSMASWRSSMRTMRKFAAERPLYIREQLIEYFNLGGIAELSLSTNSQMGQVKVNSIDINKNTPGITSPDSWTGVYFKDIPIQIEAVPQYGFHFIGWETKEDQGLIIYDDMLDIVLDGDMELTAFFVANTIQSAFNAIERLPLLLEITLMDKSRVVATREIINYLTENKVAKEKDVKNIEKLIDIEARVDELEKIAAKDEHRELINKTILILLILCLSAVIATIGRRYSYDF